MEKFNAAEHSIITKYKKTLFHKFIGAVKDYRLISRGDRIAVCISGGKDSMLLAKLMQELSRHGDYPFDMEFIVMDPGYNPANRQKIIQNAEILEIPIRIFDTDIFSSVMNIEKNPCYLCARMRRGHLYKQAQELGCKKIALGHHFDDVIETILMGMLYGAQVQTMMPRIKSTNFEGMELIRPMYYIREKDIISWKNYNKLDFLQCACRFTEQNAMLDGTGTSKRQEIKLLIRELKKVNPQVEMNIFRSVERVNLSTVIGYYFEGEEHNFLERFDNNEN
ncbi:MAG: tRNA 2-thiocytidine biosynthesis protein TtcA [Clostridia bacterium]|nr:tRNA 2-thiocytidine biosynthesis protein TtcA [Clostridia bacterium]